MTGTEPLVLAFASSCAAPGCNASGPASAVIRTEFRLPVAALACGTNCAEANAVVTANKVTAFLKFIDTLPIKYSRRPLTRVHTISMMCWEGFCRQSFAVKSPADG